MTYYFVPAGSRKMEEIITLETGKNCLRINNNNARFVYGNRWRNESRENLFYSRAEAERKIHANILSSVREDRIRCEAELTVLKIKNRLAEGISPEPEPEPETETDTKETENKKERIKTAALRILCAAGLTLLGFAALALCARIGDDGSPAVLCWMAAAGTLFTRG